jgi:protein-L-isoaspartate O-methyltransferase
MAELIPVTASDRTRHSRILRRTLVAVASTCQTRVWLASVLVVAIGASLNAQAPNDDADASRLIDLLTLNRRSIVADIGAGSGPLTIQIGSRVRRVFSTDLNPTRRAEIQAAMAVRGLFRRGG